MSRLTYLKYIKEYRDRRNQLVPHGLSVRDYCLRWIAVFYGVTPEDPDLRVYAINHAYVLFNGIVSVERLDNYLEANDSQWMKYSIHELSRICGTDSMTIRKNWGKFFEDAPQKLYNVTVFADAFNRLSIHLPQVEPGIKELITPR